MKHGRADYQHIQDPSGKIPADEPVFLIRAQDRLGRRVLRLYAQLAEWLGYAADFVQHLRDLADEFDRWPSVKDPDLPKK